MATASNIWNSCDSSWWTTDTSARTVQTAELGVWRGGNAELGQGTKARHMLLEDLAKKHPALTDIKSNHCIL
jgi:hypothetical protein